MEFLLRIPEGRRRGRKGRVGADIEENARRGKKASTYLERAVGASRFVKRSQSIAKNTLPFSRQETADIEGRSRRRSGSMGSSSIGRRISKLQERVKIMAILLKRRLIAFACKFVSITQMPNPFRERGREGGRKGEREGGRQKGREGRREGGKEGGLTARSAAAGIESAIVLSARENIRCALVK